MAGDSGWGFRSQEFGLRGTEMAGQARMAGAQALGQSIAQAPANFMSAMKARQDMEIDLADARSRLAMDELKRQRMAQDLEWVNALQDSDMRYYAKEAARLDLEMRRKEFDQADEAHQTRMNVAYSQILENAARGAVETEGDKYYRTYWDPSAKNFTKKEITKEEADRLSRFDTRDIRQQELMARIERDDAELDMRRREEERRRAQVGAEFIKDKYPPWYTMDQWAPEDRAQYEDIGRRILGGGGERSQVDLQQALEASIYSHPLIRKVNDPHLAGILQQTILADLNQNRGEIAKMVKNGQFKSEQDYIDTLVREILARDDALQMVLRDAGLDEPSAKITVERIRGLR